MKHYDNVRLRKGIGWVDAAGDGFVAPPDGEELAIAARPAGVDVFLVYAVDVPRPVALLTRTPQDAWCPDDEAVERTLSAGFETVVVLSSDAPGVAAARCRSSAPEPLEDAACALWALKAKGGWDEAPSMTFQISLPSGDPNVHSLTWLMARSSDACAVDISRARNRWEVVHAELSAAPDLTAMRVILVDVDGMMIYNDACTHVEGDLVLLRVWACLEDAAARDGAGVVRVGGEEFAVIVNERAPGTAVRLAEAMRQAVEGLNVSYRHPERGPGRITISAGVVAVGEPSRLADDASDPVYEAKRAGRNRVAVRAAGTSTGS